MKLTPMKTLLNILCLLFVLGLGLLYTRYRQEPDWKALTDSQWRARLSPEQYEVLRERFTEDAYSGKLLKEHRSGVYRCAGCGAQLFLSRAKFDSGTGWPSFDQPQSEKSVTYRRQNTPLAVAVEVRCARCGGHLGHVFPDGPTSTGKRYCMNSVALKFEPTASKP